MRLTLASSGKTVDLRTDPSEAVSLRAAEKAVLRLFHALPRVDNNEDQDDDQPFGFALSSDTERAPEAEAVEADDDD